MEAFKAGAFGPVISVGSEEFPVSCAERRLYDIEKLRDLLLRIFLDRLIAFDIFDWNCCYDYIRKYLGMISQNLSRKNSKNLDLEASIYRVIEMSKTK